MAILWWKILNRDCWFWGRKRQLHKRKKGRKKILARSLTLRTSTTRRLEPADATNDFNSSGDDTPSLANRLVGLKMALLDMPTA